MNEIIKVKKLEKIYPNGIKALKGINFSVKKGEIFGFLGPNGAGKTTTIKILVTLLKPTKGKVIVNGYDVVNDAEKVRRSIGIVFQTTTLDNYLTGRENLDYHARMYGIPKREREKRIREVLKLVELEKKADVLVKYYSGGMKRRLELARAFLHKPKILFLDEPTLGLDAQTRRVIWKYIKTLNKKEGTSIFLTTHYLEEADQLCDRIAIIDNGKIIKIDSPSNLKSSIGKDVLVIRSKNLLKLLKIIKKFKWVKRFKIYNNSLNLYVERGEEKIVKIVNIAEKNKIKITSLNLRKPSLEDVYLYYTSKTIREEETNPKFLPPSVRMRK